MSIRCNRNEELNKKNEDIEKVTEQILKINEELNKKKKEKEDLFIIIDKEKKN